MSRKLVSAIFFGLLLIGFLNSAKIQPVEVAICSEYEVDLEKAALFLNSTQFDPLVGLCREAPNVANNTYWLVSDNLLAYHALKYYYPETAEIICATMLSYGYFRSYKHEVMFGTTIPYIPFKTSNTYVVAQIGTKLVETEVCNGSSMDDYKEYADLCIYAALHFYWSDNISQAIDHFNIVAKTMWNSTLHGIYDKVSEDAENKSEVLIFSTYKLSLLLYCSRILGQPLEDRNSIEETLWLMQDETGGLHTDYDANLNYTGSDVNTETTALAILAYQYEPKVANRPALYPPDLSVPPDSQEIQEAINTANPEDTLFIYNGTYYENVIVNKSVSLIGESKDATIIDGRGSGTVIMVSSSNSIVNNLTIRNSGEKRNSEWPCGIWLNNVSNCDLIDNIITNNTLGVFLDSSSSNTLKNNNMTVNRYNFGVLGLELSHYIQDVDTSNLVDGKPVYYWVNHHEGEVPSSAGYVALINSTNIMIKNLGLKNNLAGMLIVYSRNSTITNNVVSKNFVGIWLLFSSNDTVSGNKVTTNGLVNGLGGVGIFNSSNNMISNNEISANNGYGISLYGFSDHNSVVGNNIVGNSLKGIDLYNASYNNISWNIIANHTESTWFSVELDYFSSYNNICFNNITDNGNAISIESWSSHNRVHGNIVMRSGWYGIELISNANYNSVSTNTIASNKGPGIRLSGSSNNTVSGNNFIDNAQQADTDGYSNFWDNGIEGNYWSDYIGSDTNCDGIGDIQYEIDSYNIDRYPLMGMFSDFNVTSECHVQTICNSSISDFQFNGTAISFDVTGDNGTSGFCRICIPTALMNAPFKVYVNSAQVSYNLLPCSNETCSYLYFNYTHSTQEVIIISEFPSFLILPLSMMATLLAVMVYRRKGISV